MFFGNAFIPAFALGILLYWIFFLAAITLNRSSFHISIIFFVLYEISSWTFCFMSFFEISGSFSDFFIA
jgi:hypothetical protein